MVSVGVSKLGRTELVFVEPSIKIDGVYYRDVLLKKQLLPIIRRISGDMFIFQQDNAPAHRAWDTVELFKRDTCIHRPRLVATKHLPPPQIPPPHRRIPLPYC